MTPKPPHEPETPLTRSKGVSVILVVLPFEEPSEVIDIVAAATRVCETIANIDSTPGIAIVRTAAARIDSGPKELGEILLLLGNSAVRAACERMLADFGWPNAWVQAVNDEALAALEGEGGIH